MLSGSHVIAAFDAKRSAFASYGEGTDRALERYLAALRCFSQQSSPEIIRRQARRPKPGALPTSERVPGRPVVLPFNVRWSNHREARQWAIRVLHGVPTLAVDGSQITPTPDFSTPVGAIQVGWFENPHRGDRPYGKELLFEVLSPDELSGSESDSPYSDTQVNARRFELECRVLSERMIEASGREPAPICFFDGSLVISFAAQLRPALQRRYVSALVSLLDVSERTRVPVIGYIATSHASDLVSALHPFTDGSRVPALSDARLLQCEMTWGDRTEALVCARDDRLFDTSNQDLSYYDRVLFVYLKATADAPPARLDLPAWLLDAGVLDQVIDVVRAECIVDTGYPYAIETADALAVITVRDRDRFYRMFQEYLGGIGLAMTYSRKAQSKRERR